MHGLLDTRKTNDADVTLVERQPFSWHFMKIASRADRRPHYAIATFIEARINYRGAAFTAHGTTFSTGTNELMM